MIKIQNIVKVKIVIINLVIEMYFGIRVMKNGKLHYALNIKIFTQDCLTMQMRLVKQQKKQEKNITKNLRVRVNIRIKGFM